MVPLSITVFLPGQGCCPAKCWHRLHSYIQASTVEGYAAGAKRSQIKADDVSVALTDKRFLLTGADAVPGALHMPVVPEQLHANALDSNMRTASAAELPSASAGALLKCLHTLSYAAAVCNTGDREA